MICDRIHRCAFFKKALSSMPASVSRFRKLYCEGDSDMCARHYVITKIAYSRSVIDNTKLSILDDFMRDLFPNDIDRAREFVSRFGS